MSEKIGLFSPLSLGALTLPNRILMAPMTRSRATDAGVPEDYVATYYAQRASSGLLITECVSVNPMAKGYVRTPGIWNDEQREGWRKVADAVKAKGGRIFMQLYHPGRIALPEFLPGQAQPVSASNVKAAGQNFNGTGMQDFVEPRPLTIAEIKEAVADFGKAAKSAIEVGFDGVELHGANGYLVQQFLSDNTNLREDEYGGTPENRARFALEVVDELIAQIGVDRVGVKISPAGSFNDMHESDPEVLYGYLVKELSARRLAYLHNGTFAQEDWHSKLRSLYDGTFFAAVGFTQERGEALLNQGGADAIVYGALYIANPDLVERFSAGKPLAAPDQSTFYTPGEKGYTDYPVAA